VIFVQEVHMNVGRNLYSQHASYGTEFKVFALAVLGVLALMDSCESLW
jgi:uncharacterized transporter YbjL